MTFFNMGTLQGLLMRQFSIYTVFTFAGFLLIGGVFAYAKAASITCLIVAVFSSLIMVLSGLGMLKNRPSSAYLALTTALILTALFGFRFANSSNFMPSGLILIASAIVGTIVSFHCISMKTAS